jgi:Cu(I)/Ag(I) efflux system periplasmic protein CusF
MNIRRTLALAVLLACSVGAASANEMSEGEIRKVDKDAAKLTIRHGELKNLDMPPMTMVFRVKDKAMLDKIASGDKVRFTAEKIEGALTVTVLESVKP